MCRWLAYSGPPIFLEALVFEPENSLCSQSLQALESKSPTNGDGFGIGWYDHREEPGLFREVLPAWNDDNLRSLAAQIRSGLFFGHVRASTGTVTNRSNCHPFRHGRWMFMHNGMIGGFDRLRRALMLAIEPNLFGAVKGNTDSEVFFHLLLSNGLEDDPVAALSRTVGQVTRAMTEAEVTEPLRLTVALTDGRTIYALRHASDKFAPSLYYGCGAKPWVPDGARGVGDGDPAGDSILILSEPLDHVETQWTAVPKSHVLIAGDGGVASVPFEIAA